MVVISLKSLLLLSLVCTLASTDAVLMRFPFLKLIQNMKPMTHGESPHFSRKFSQLALI